LALFLVVHTPNEDDHAVTAPPTRLVELARATDVIESSARWISTLTPDLQDERIFTLWEAEDPEKILSVMERYGFLNHMTAQPIRVQQWGPSEVLAAEQELPRL
jgi:hypothetical protein